MLHQRRLSEALEYKDMVEMLKPTIHVDEFAAKMGDDDDIITVSFFVRDQQAARDLQDWFEKGYDWVLDADRSPGEIKPGRYLVFVEMRRRSRAGEQIETMLDDLGTLTEHTGSDWMMHYDGQERPFTRESFDQTVPLSPQAYREKKEKNLNEMRAAAGIDTKQVHRPAKDLRQLQAAAGI